MCINMEGLDLGIDMGWTISVLCRFIGNSRTLNNLHLLPVKQVCLNQYLKQSISKTEDPLFQMLSGK